MKKLKLILKILLGLVFILSGVLKLIDIDKFELYVYSFNFLCLSFSYIAARLLIAFEFLLGVSLVANVFNKYVVRTTLAMLVGFTLFLVYLIVIGRNDNCHCFGEYVQFNPVESIVPLFSANKLLPKSRLYFLFFASFFVLFLSIFNKNEGSRYALNAFLAKILLKVDLLSAIDVYNRAADFFLGDFQNTRRRQTVKL